MAYAEATKVTVEKTVSQIVSMVRTAGGSRFAQLDDDQRFVLAFSMADRQVRFTVRFPDPSDDQFAEVRVNQSSSRKASNSERIERWETRRRQRMRALLLVIKAKLESVESEVETFEEAFLSNVVMADGATIYERVHEPIALEYQSGKPQPMLLEGPRP